MLTICRILCNDNSAFIEGLSTQSKCIILPETSTDSILNAYPLENIK